MHYKIQGSWATETTQTMCMHAHEHTHMHKQTHTYNTLSEREREHTVVMGEMKADFLEYAKPFPLHHHWHLTLLLQGQNPTPKAVLHQERRRKQLRCK